MLGELMRFASQSRWPARTARRRRPAWSPASWPKAARTDLRDRGTAEERRSNARLGAGRTWWRGGRERCLFLHLQPLIAIVTNIDNDHLGTHGGDFARCATAS